MNDLFREPLQVANLGLDSFAHNLESVGQPVQSIHWHPVADGDPVVGWQLAQTLADERVNQANALALSRYLSANPVLIDIAPARDVIAELGSSRTLLHAGPPIEWSQMCGPMQGGLCGAVLLEGWAKTLDEAYALLASGAIQLAPNHHHHAVGPMAGIISPSMPVWVVEDTEHHHRTFSNLNEGLGKVLRFGANSPDVLERLAWLSRTLAPTIREALQKTGPIELKPLIAQALHMGDECHNRNVAATGLLIKKLAPALAKCEHGAEVLSFMEKNDHFFLNLSMACCKAMLDAARDVPYSSMVVAMARNGVNFGIQLSGTGNAWFQAPANPVDGLFFPGYGLADAAADLGDSAITETAGIGGFAMAASPAIVKFVGGTAQDAMRHSQAMHGITLTQNPLFTLPNLNFLGSGSGIDARLVLDLDTLPIINTGIAHKKAGVGQIGAGITTAPKACFMDGIQALYQTLTK